MVISEQKGGFEGAGGGEDGRPGTSAAESPERADHVSASDQRRALPLPLRHRPLPAHSLRLLPSIRPIIPPPPVPVNSPRPNPSALCHPLPRNPRRPSQSLTSSPVSFRPSEPWPYAADVRPHALYIRSHTCHMPKYIWHPYSHSPPCYRSKSSRTTYILCCAAYPPSPSLSRWQRRHESGHQHH